VNPVRNSSRASNAAGIILGLNPGTEQWGIISNGVKASLSNLHHFQSLKKFLLFTGEKKSIILKNKFNRRRESFYDPGVQ
jgi:hypothetical protein